MFGGESQFKIKDPHPENKLAKLIRDTLPLYKGLFAYEYHPPSLLAESMGCVDLAYLVVVLRYSHKAKSERFPCGFCVCPPEEHSAAPVASTTSLATGEPPSIATVGIVIKRPSVATSSSKVSKKS